MSNNTNTAQPEKSKGSFWAFLIPSLIGLFLFMAPISYQGDLTIPVAILAKSIQAVFGESLVAIITAIVAFMSVASVLSTIFKPAFITSNSFLNGLFNPSPLWLLVRLIGGAAAFMAFFQVGPEFIWEENTGGLVLEGLLPTLFSVFIFAGLLLPLLLNFGLLELFGTLLSKIMRPIFNLPGRSAIDCMASWLGDGSVGILLTSKQYEKKFYTQREAAVVGTTFSAVSITFSLVVIAQVELEHLFLPFYAAICLAGIVAAVIIPRLPPLSMKKDTFIDGSKPHKDADAIPAGHSTFSWGLELAVNKASQVKSAKSVFGEGVRNAVDMVFGVLPVVMGLGTMALVIAEYTSVFSFLGQPFIPFLELLGVPEAVAASETIVVGFADMFIPAILAASIDNEMTRFVIAAMSVTQLIYMSEVGALLLGSKIPVNILELFIIFILRTLITLPVIAGVAHLIF
ncbi:YjiH family protein [Vibrio crassostreae]|uniref:YjiH family protein n=1 Tax=Vibrio crassostreae TaxID=246167 RepID=UPI00104DFBC2|nr:YjiH family protein [Vibrio crassostreae]TCN94228.1 nucleoside recognition membrane protein YjiH [Vibrio crassostreae]CAK1811417.1 Nucleoside recognition membrane protein YjiH [Vibrio crassostreae]CAK1873049.1 Nucleoside recognition membrane protein YjiH [Vibrio crassostreae]CAK1887680.1 Nucleoside recognition membrane protein YjiH [Vibrio crassostreae]CAK2620010.1 Nucleoside recognition membrane protein YjiH [Vibrio crassostreae]